MSATSLIRPDSSSDVAIFGPMPSMSMAPFDTKWKMCSANCAGHDALLQ